ncbi:MAG: hypothetical protein H6602_14200 [Flavobacteriales bacterium]|nr:hypothetical protein [Flavobacteriales bacterium]
MPIIANALSGNHTIGLLPTGSGKSVCYQLAAILQPAISFVVCPIKSLMYDQKADLDSIRFTSVNLITSDNKGPERREFRRSLVMVNTCSFLYRQRGFKHKRSGIICQL